MIAAEPEAPAGTPSPRLPDSGAGLNAPFPLFARCHAHVMARIRPSRTGSQPFFHLFVEDIFPDDFYQAMRAHMLGLKHGDETEDRLQDNPAFANKRFNLAASTDEVVGIVRALFSDSDIMAALLAKFYVSPSRQLVDALSIHHEFEYFFTEAGRFQNIHVDIPPKFMSFVFYIPERPVTGPEEERNGTILYDKSLAPHYPARFKANSVCIFVPHFYTYHGFSSTIDRDVLVMFYVNQGAMAKWKALRQQDKDAPPFNGLLDAIAAKLRSYPLIEYDGEQKIASERAACRVNAPRGRVLV